MQANQSVQVALQQLKDAPWKVAASIIVSSSIVRRFQAEVYGLTDLSSEHFSNLSVENIVNL